MLRKMKPTHSNLEEESKESIEEKHKKHEKEIAAQIDELNRKLAAVQKSVFDSFRSGEFQIKFEDEGEEIVELVT